MPAGNVEAYQIEVANSPILAQSGRWTPVGSVSTTYFEDRQSNPGEYYYRVSAIREGNTVASDTVSIEVREKKTPAAAE